MQLFTMIEQLQMPHTAVCQAVKVSSQLQQAGWYLCVWILFMWYQKMKASCLVAFRDEETFETAAAMLSRESRTNSLTWEVMWFYPLDIFWSNVTEHIYIFHHFAFSCRKDTEIEHVLRPAIFWDCVQHKVVIPFHCIGITNQSYLQRSRCPSRTCLLSGQLAHTWCLMSVRGADCYWAYMVVADFQGRHRLV